MPWYVRRGTKIQGPIAAAALKKLAEGGQLKPTDELAKDPAGPWTAASRTSLFTAPTAPREELEAPPPVSTPAVPAPAAKPMAIVPAEPAPRALEPTIERHQVAPPAAAPRVNILVATLRVVGQSLAERSRRRHELKLAKIQAEALRPRAPSAVAPRTAVPPAAQMLGGMPPQITQTTIVNVTQKGSGGCGCSGAGCLLLFLLGLLLLVAIGISTPVTP